MPRGGQFRQSLQIRVGRLLSAHKESPNKTNSLFGATQRSNHRFSRERRVGGFYGGAETGEDATSLTGVGPYLKAAADAGGFLRGSKKIGTSSVMQRSDTIGKILASRKRITSAAKWGNKTIKG